MEKGIETDTGARTADRNVIAANWFSIARSVWNMHDALLIEQRRTNQLLEALIEAQGGVVPKPNEPPKAAARTETAGSWHADPTGRYAWRWWNDDLQCWTTTVSNGDEQEFDPKIVPQHESAPPVA